MSKQKVRYKIDENIKLKEMKKVKLQEIKYID